MNDEPGPKIDAAEIVRTAHAAGIEFDAHGAERWLLAMSDASPDLAHDTGAGIFGHRVALLDFNPDDLAYFRRLSQHIRTVRHPAVESAIAISGSSAQGQVQLFPGDCDFFERVHIHAPDASAARHILRDIFRATALRAFSEPNIVLVEANLGVYPGTVLERGQARAAGDPITWTPKDVLNGFLTVQDTAGTELRIAWDEVDAGRGWTYLGWIIADRAQGRIALASNMLDVTWQAPDGAIHSLDGMIDPFFQEVYLDASELPVLAKLKRHIAPEALKAYKDQMLAQVRHYAHEEPNFGKVSKRLYNLFRLTDQLESAAYVRELFDEPTAGLYQVPGLLEAAEVALRDPAAEIERATVLKQIDLVIEQVKNATEGREEARIVRELGRLRHDVLREPPGADWDEILREVRRQSAEIVNDFFRSRLMAYAAIREFVEGLGDKHA